MRLRSIALFLLVFSALSARADFIDLYANPYDVPQNKAPRIGHRSLVLTRVQIDAGSYKPIDMDGMRAFSEGAYAGGGLPSSRYYELASSTRFPPAVTPAPLVEYRGCPPM